MHLDREYTIHPPARLRALLHGLGGLGALGGSRSDALRLRDFAVIWPPTVRYSQSFTLTCPARGGSFRAEVERWFSTVFFTTVDIASKLWRNTRTAQSTVMWQKSPQLDPRYRSLRDSGKSIADTVTSLRQADLSPVECIKAIRDYEQVDLGEAKRLYCDCPPYEKEREAHEHLIDQAIAAIEDDA